MSSAKVNVRILGGVEQFLQGVGDGLVVFRQVNVLIGAFLCRFGVGHSVLVGINIVA